MKFSFFSPSAARMTSRSRAVFGVVMCGSMSPLRSAQPWAYYRASLRWARLSASLSGTGSSLGALTNSCGSTQEMGAERPTPRGSKPTKSYALAVFCHSGALVVTRLGKRSQEPPGLYSSAPCRSSAVPVLPTRSTAILMMRPFGLV